MQELTLYPLIGWNWVKIVENISLTAIEMESSLSWAHKNFAPLIAETGYIQDFQHR